jgi:hypothetical protein
MSVIWTRKLDWQSNCVTRASLSTFASGRRTPVAGQPGDSALVSTRIRAQLGLGSQALTHETGRPHDEALARRILATLDG